MHRSSVVLPLNADNREYLVFGMTWAVVIGHKPEKESISRARKAKASHYVLPGGHASVVGYVQFPARKKVRGELVKTWFSAGQMFADQFPSGVHTHLFPLDDEEHHWWLVACQDGEVIPGTDCVFDSRDEAEDALVALNDQHPGAINVPTLMPNSPSGAAKLIELQHPIAALPLWAKVCSVAALALFVLDQGASLWDMVNRAGQDPVRTQVNVDASAAWKEQLDRWQKTVQLDGPLGFKRLLSQVTEQVPMKLGGWPLASFECVPYPAGWKCNAVYKRGPVGSSTNQSLLAALPSGWTAQWPGIDKGKIDDAKVSWAFEARRTVLDRAKLPGQVYVSNAYTSSVQAVYAAFKVAVTPTAMARPDVQAPTYVNADGQAVPVAYTDDLAAASRIPAQKGFEFTGPLRSMTVMPLPDDSAIKTFSLKVAEAVEPSLANSTLTATVKGVFYVQ